MSKRPIGKAERIARRRAITEVLVPPSDDIITVVDATEVLDPSSTGAVYAWGEEPDEEETWQEDRWRILTTCRHLARRLDGRIIPAVIAAVAIAAVSIAGMLVLTPRPDRFTIRPPVEVLPPPTPKPAPVAKPPAPAPPVAAPPPVQRVTPPVLVPRQWVPAQPQAAPQSAPPPQAPPGALEQFRSSLAQQGMHFNQSPPTENSEAESMCQDLANGGSVQSWIDATKGKSTNMPPGGASEVVHDAIQAYCPQYDNR